ncbi:MAG: indole-3-glycerol phosphate synthase TrpC [Anaerolineae bacterium]|nr:indole-3-glycerol phosphate synthase TrpC [Anaerolineae bacterium]
MTAQYVKTDTILDKILAHKVEEIADDKAKFTLVAAQQKASLTVDPESAPRDFMAALRRENVALIAEVKKASPSKGVLIDDFDPVAIGTTYAQNGASAISVLTDEHFFQGHLGYMGAVRKAVDVPVLRKDFIIDPYQVYVARAFSADACLLIVAALSDSQLTELHALIIELGMAALVEVHSEEELERALKIGAKLIGVNNRDLKTFNVDLETTARVARNVPDDVLLVADGGIRNAEDVYQMGQLGAHAVLVGESLVKSENIACAVYDYSHQKREVSQ